MENNKFDNEIDDSRSRSQPSTLVAAYIIAAVVIGAIMFGVFIYLK